MMTLYNVQPMSDRGSHLMRLLYEAATESYQTIAMRKTAAVV